MKKKLALVLVGALAVGATLPEAETSIIRYDPDGVPGGGYGEQRGREAARLLHLGAQRAHHFGSLGGRSTW